MLNLIDSMINPIEDFIDGFEKIKSMGWIKTHRSGPTGIGKTLEDLLGIKENNKDAPDFGDYELKSGRINSNSMLTLFTKAPYPPKANSYLREKFGYFSAEYEFESKVLHSTLSATQFTEIAGKEHSLKIECDDEKIYIVSELGREDVYWTKEQLEKAFNKKYKNKLVYALAESRGEGSKEEFRFLEAYEIYGFDFEIIHSLIMNGSIYVDLRIGQYRDGRTHDHGTGFRIKERDQYKLFKNKMKIV